jgi:hypothetical protein
LPGARGCQLVSWIYRVARPTPVALAFGGFVALCVLGGGIAGIVTTSGRHEWAYGVGSALGSLGLAAVAAAAAARIAIITDAQLHAARVEALAELVYPLQTLPYESFDWIGKDLAAAEYALDQLVAVGASDEAAHLARTLATIEIALGRSGRGEYEPPS